MQFSRLYVDCDRPDLGPAKMGYIIYFLGSRPWLANWADWVFRTLKVHGGVLGMGDRGTARYIFSAHWSAGGARDCCQGGLLVWVLRDAAGDYKLASR